MLKDMDRLCLGLGFGQFTSRINSLLLLKMNIGFLVFTSVITCMLHNILNFTYLFTSYAALCHKIPAPAANSPQCARHTSKWLFSCFLPSRLFDFDSLSYLDGH